MADIEHSEALDSIVEEIQKGKLLLPEYTLMLQVFINETEGNNETNRMALALAKKSVRRKYQEVDVSDIGLIGLE